MKFSVKIGGKDYTKYAEMPFQIFRKLDESLDMASIRLFYTDKKEEFEPFTLVEITIKDDVEKTYQFYIASDVTEEVLSTSKVNHTLVLVEETKSIERLLVTKTTTNPIAKDFTEFQTNVENFTSKNASEYYVKIPQNFVTPVEIGTEVIIPKLRDVYDYMQIGVDIEPYIVVEDFNGEELERFSPYEEHIYTFEKQGENNIVYKWKRDTSGFLTWKDAEIRFKINVVNKFQPAVEKTITSVVESLLNTCETIRKGETPKFTFNKEQAEQYKDTVCPEMSFTKQTLWEALRQIGGVIHAIPRLIDNEVYFDSYESIIYSNIKDKKPISNTGTFDIEQFCSTIESSVDNLISNDNASQGSIEDYGGLFKTTRTEQVNAQIKDDNMFIETSLPIGRILKVEVGYLPDETYVGDITNYVFERSEYDALSSYDTTFPTSKALALYYKLGERNISGLTFQKDNAVDSIFENTAIENIIRHKLTDQEPNWWDSLWRDYDEFELQFRVTYQPYYSATLRQVKPNLKDLKFKSVLSYTQGANSISTQAYGEHLKGAVARLGTAERRKTYILKHLSEVPSAGDKFNKEYRISEVNCEFYPEYILCEIGLSKKFNRWSDYVGVDNELRMYEVSEKQVAERPVIWEDYAVIQKTSKNKLRENSKSHLVEDGYEFINGIWTGYEYVLGADSATRVWFGDFSGWNKLDSGAELERFASGYNSLGKPMVIGTPYYASRYGNVFYWDENDTRISTDLDFGEQRKITGIAYGNGVFIALAGLTYYQESNYCKVLVGTPSENSITWETQSYFPIFGDKWRITRNEYKKLFVCVSDGGWCEYRTDDDDITDGIMQWDTGDCPQLIDIIDVKSFNEYVWAFNGSKLAKGTYDIALTWNEYNFPCDDIIDFGVSENVYIAISRTKIYHSMDLENWFEYIPNIGDMQHIIIGDKIIITNNTENVYELELKGSDTFLTQQGVYTIGNTYVSGVQNTPVKLVNAITYDSQAYLMYDYWLPVIVSAVGNTLQVQFEYVDNFSAGTYANKDFSGSKAQTYAPYGDLYGEAKYLSVEFFDYNPFDYNNDFDTYKNVGDKLPIITLEQDGFVKSVLNSSSNLFRGNKNHIILDKDSREKIKFSYCLHFVTNDDDIVVGSGLSQINSFAMRREERDTSISPVARLYILNREIGDFEKVVDLTGAVEQESSINCYIDTEFGKIRFRKKHNDTMLADGKAWVLVIKNPYNSEEDILLFGKNVEFKEGDLADEVWGNYEIAFTHDVNEFL